MRVKWPKRGWGGGGGGEGGSLFSFLLRIKRSILFPESASFRLSVTKEGEVLS